LQHGVLDNSFAWLAGGATSLACRAYDAGFDVWMGNFRGAAGEEGSGARAAGGAGFWDFSLNEHAFEDVPAFVSYIASAKRSELAALHGAAAPAPRITAIAHSVGLGPPSCLTALR
jgi:lysosomal acid lipase/cholesteryl ester hydrolase